MSSPARPRARSLHVCGGGALLLLLLVLLLCATPSSATRRESKSFADELLRDDPHTTTTTTTRPDPMADTHTRARDKRSTETNEETVHGTPKAPESSSRSGRPLPHVNALYRFQHTASTSRLSSSSSSAPSARSGPQRYGSVPGHSPTNSPTTGPGSDTDFLDSFTASPSPSASPYPIPAHARPKSDLNEEEEEEPQPKGRHEQEDAERDENEGPVVDLDDPGFDWPEAYSDPSDPSDSTRRAPVDEDEESAWAMADEETNPDPTSFRPRRGGSSKPMVDLTGRADWLKKRDVRVVAPRFSRLVFDEQFDELNLTRWEHEITAGGGGNWEFQYYTNNRSNTFTHDGVLYIKPTLTADRFGPDLLSALAVLDLGGSQPPDVCTGPGFYGCLRLGGAGGNVINPVQSARIRTAQSFNFKYGRMEVRAKLPRGDWLWPAIWLMPRWNVYGPWPASGEVDVVESRGNEGFCNEIGSTLHVGPYVQANDYRRYHRTYKLKQGDFADAFHVYGVVWTPDFFYMYLDQDDEAHRVMVTRFDESVYTRAGWQKQGFDNPWRGRNYSAPFDQEFYIALNVAVGGTNGYFADSMPRKPWTNLDRNAISAFWNGRTQWLPTWVADDVALQVDWIRVWQQSEHDQQTTPPHRRHSYTAP